MQPIYPNENPLPQKICSFEPNSHNSKQWLSMDIARIRTGLQTGFAFPIFGLQFFFLGHVRPKGFMKNEGIEMPRL